MLVTREACAVVRRANRAKTTNVMRRNVGSMFNGRREETRRCQNNGARYEALCDASRTQNTAC